MKDKFTPIKGNVTTPLGFRAAGHAAGIKRKGKKDMALIVSDVPAVVAGTFTTNQVKAAPVKLDMQHVKSGKACAIVVNSGNANACTGKIGMIHAKAMATAVARRIGCKTESILVCSTGRIGTLLPIVKIEQGIKVLLGTVSPDGGHSAAESIMTTDTFPKEVAVKIKAGKNVIHIGGIAKGAGMIQPKMATMLGFITTDAKISKAALQKALKVAVDQSFNRISVDGDTSTNDTVLLLANGLAGDVPMSAFQAGLNYVTRELSKMIVRDGEGVSRFVYVNVTGAANEKDAEIAARAVVNSTLVKCCWCGGDPNWGRIMDALGYSRAKVTEELVDISYDGLLAVKGGMPTKTPFAKLQKVAEKQEFTIDIDLNLGRGRCAMYATDLTEKYVTLNKGE
jgi:glutamate N-acetyltransferase / amino-acid N-acetyltransferase